MLNLTGVPAKKAAAKNTNGTDPDTALPLASTELELEDGTQFLREM